MAFNFYRSITIDKTKVPNTDRTDFPVLISGTYSYLKTVGNGGDVQNGSGYDVGFYSDSALTTKLKWQTEKYTASTGEVIYRVKVPTVSSSTNTVIYMAYGDSGISTDQSDAGNTWRAAYKGVYHLSDGSTLSATDSTSNANNGTINGSAGATAGKIDGGLDLPFPTGGHNVTGSGITLNGSSFTLAFWVQPNTSSGGHQSWLSVGTVNSVGETMFVKTVGLTELQFEISGDNLTVSGLSNLSSAFNHVVATYDVSTNEQILYLNGTNIGSRTATNDFTGNGTFYMGNWANITWECWGAMDEVTFLSEKISADEVATLYNTENDPSTFYSVGSATVPSSGSNTNFFFFF